MYRCLNVSSEEARVVCIRAGRTTINLHARDERARVLLNGGR